MARKRSYLCCLLFRAGINHAWFIYLNIRFSSMIKIIERYKIVSIVSILIVVASFVFIYNSTIIHENIGSDSCCYICLAKALLINHNYNFNQELHITYPPGYPLLIALSFMIFGEDYEVIIKLNAIFGFLIVLLLYFSFKDLSRNFRCLCILFMISSSIFFTLTTCNVNSDIPFMMTLVLSFFLFAKVEKKVISSNRGLSVTESLGGAEWS